MLFSTFLISPALKPVTVRLCLGLVKSGPTGPLSSLIGALVDCLRSRGGVVWGVAVAIVAHNWTVAEKRSTGEARAKSGEG